jgi:hypothetical protein
VLLGAAAGLALALDAERSAAELFRCTGPDGRTVFTDDKSVCPQAESYEPKAEVQSSGSRPASRAAEPAGEARRDRAMQRDQAAAAESGEAARWQQLKAQKEEDLRIVSQRRDRLVSFVAWCNRGGSVITRDDAGIAQGVKCNELNDRLAELDREEAELRAYLGGGLEEECRRAGCQPGWIR